MPADGDTIAAISSAAGPAARMIVRASGPTAIAVAQRLGVPGELSGGSAVRCPLTFDGLAVTAWLYLFRAPHSYTGEDLVEFHLPGNPVLIEMFLRELYRLGARASGPGEFTERAYFNGRMDLTAAEGVAATIAAGGEQELTAARRLMAGELARRLAPIMEGLADTLALVEVGIDFVEEDVTFIAAADLLGRLHDTAASLATLLADSARLEQLAREPRIVLVGRPNAGKSTLLNALAGHPRAVVSPVAGTTRDVLSAEITLDRGAALLLDVAGLDEGAESDQHEIHRQMQARARQAIERADVVVLVEDVTDRRARLALPRQPDLVVRTKGDLLPAPAPDEGVVSAVSGIGLDVLKHKLDRACFGDASPSAAAGLALNARHVQVIEDARDALSRAAQQVSHGGAELVALDLREALDSLGAVLGRIAPDDLLGRIFACFCIGK